MPSEAKADGERWSPSSGTPGGVVRPEPSINPTRVCNEIKANKSPYGTLAVKPSPVRISRGMGWADENQA